MNLQHELFCFADSVFYDMPSRWKPESPSLIPEELVLPSGWAKSEKDVWISFSPDAAVMPKQGWKIHASATQDNARRVCRAVWDYCVHREIAFKVLRNSAVFVALNSKYTPRGNSGKLVTIYPADETELETVLNELGAVLEGEAGPYVLSDVRWNQGPLYVRYGGFAERYCVSVDGDVTSAIADPNGELVPDSRKPTFDAPVWVDIPSFLTPHIEARAGAGNADEFPFRVTEALHFSNGGGVYLADRVSDGASVVLKEARPHAGLDAEGRDAVERLQHERSVLERLDGIDGVPACYGEYVAGGHHFLSMEYVNGRSLQNWIACELPLVTRVEPTPEELAEYRVQALDLLDRVSKLLNDVHARGMVFGDLHPSNVVIRPDGSVALVDFELSFDIDWTLWRPALGAAGFAPGKHKQGVARETHALAALKLSVFLPVTKTLAFDRSKLEEYLNAIGRTFSLPTRFMTDLRTELSDWGKDGPADGADPVTLRLDDDEPDWPAIHASMVDAIQASATPDRNDRLFPGHYRQFATNGWDFAYGAAGVLWTLATTGFSPQPEHEQWLIDAVRRERNPRPGFYDGLHGAAYVLHRLGYARDAEEILTRAVEDSAPVYSMSLFSGLAGIGLNLLHFAELIGHGQYLELAGDIGDRLSTAVAHTHPDVHGSPSVSQQRVRGGLMHGWSGPALFLLRLYEMTGEQKHLNLAVDALHHDLDLCVTTDNGSIQVEEVGYRSLAYLEGGSAGIALVIDELLRHRQDERLTAALPRILRACSPEFVAEPQLWNGRAGLLATVARTAHRSQSRTKAEAIIDRHLRRLSWNSVSYRGDIVFPGDLGFRLSMDVATGNAGVLLGMTTATEDAAGFLPFLSSTADVERQKIAGEPANMSRR